MMVRGFALLVTAVLVVTTFATVIPGAAAAPVLEARCDRFVTGSPHAVSLLIVYRMCDEVEGIGDTSGWDFPRIPCADWAVSEEPSVMVQVVGSGCATPGGLGGVSAELSCVTAALQESGTLTVVVTPSSCSPRRPIHVETWCSTGYTRDQPRGFNATVQPEQCQAIPLADDSCEEWTGERCCAATGSCGPVMAGGLGGSVGGQAGGGFCVSFSVRPGTADVDANLEQNCGEPQVRVA